MLKVSNLIKHFPIKKGIFSHTVGYVQALNSISFNIEKGETLGLVGESGCGKTTAGRVILSLMKPTSGKVFFEGQDLFSLNKNEMRKMRRDMQLIFQDPFASLNPRLSVGSIVGEPLSIHNIAHGKEKEQRVRELLTTVGLSADHADRYPHEFSGGQRQRVGIARSLALNPKFIVCDEAVSALDVSIQAQVINLLEELQEKYNLTYLFIAHDLSVIKHISNRVAVMYLGRIVELADTKNLYSSPFHPYTKALLSAVPVLDKTKKKKRIILHGDVPTPINPPSGCYFRTRCPDAMDICSYNVPEFKNMGNGHEVACHLYN